MRQRSGCPLCGLVLSGATSEALSDAHVDHLSMHLEEYFEEEVADGRMVRVMRDGKTLYREVEAPGAEPPGRTEP